MPALPSSDGPAEGPGGGPPRPPTGPPVQHSRDLLAGGRELIIRHGAETYRLLLTSQNKLILTK